MSETMILEPITAVVTDGVAKYKLTIPQVTVEKITVSALIPAVPWSKDISGELARNTGCSGILRNGWWKRKLNQINGLTFHHTLSNSPHAVARYYVKKGGGRPSIPYAIWITETGEVLLCLAFEEGCWHDHTGHKNTHLSVGLAGRLHIHHPSETQLDAAARVAIWAVRNKQMGIALDAVKGHQDYIGTLCPGWASKRSGYWKAELMDRITSEFT